MNRYFAVALRLTCLALAGFASQVLAAPIVFNYSGGIQTWTAPATGTYVVTAIGAQGGHGTYTGDAFVGGLGASITGSFNFTMGQSFLLAVGGQGDSLPENYNGGGGGGSFFVDSAGSPLLVAGGGGGIRAQASQNGCDASITAYGTIGSGSSPTSDCAIKSTDLGIGGIVSSSSWGSGGAGFYGDGADDSLWGNGGSAWANGLLGGTDGNAAPYCLSTGGFGGGGSGAGCGGGGGGGGYSGGDGGFIGGGGGSWNTGFNQLALAGVGQGNGQITIELISAVPEPGTLALLGLGLGLAGFAAAGRRR